MKKFMLAACLLFGATAAFAGDSEPLKAILSAKSYPEAEAQLKTNLSALTTSAEKAKAYNYLVDLAMKEYGDQANIQMENQTMAQLGQKGEPKPVDKEAMYQGAYRALVNAIECNKYDQQPNEKGKVKPKYEANNAARVWNARVQLVNAGQDAAKADKQEDILKYWGLFVDSDNDPLFKSVDEKSRASEKSYFGQVARFAGVYAYQAKEYERANRYADMAMKDTAEYKEALNLKLGIQQAQLKNHTDSLNFTKTVEDLYAKDTKNVQLFGTLVNLYNQMGNKDALKKLLDAKEKEDPNNFVVYAVRGQNAMIGQDLDTAIAAFKKAIEIQPENAQILSYLGACLFDKAQKAEERAAGNSGRVPAAARAQIEPVFKEAETNLEKAKSIDPDHTNSNWPYALYRVYYRLYGPQDARTVEAEKLTK